MSISLWAYLGWMVLVALIGLGLLIWGLLHKQFEDIEEPKYTMLEDKEPIPWTRREGGRGEDAPAGGKARDQGGAG